MKRPNVLILYTDQQRWDTIRAGGNPLIHTPNLDRLAARGMLFNYAFCNTPVCMPSRQSMLSGLYPSTVGTVTNGIEMPPDLPTMPTYMKPYGYHTGNLGKLHFKNHAHHDHREPHPRYDFDTLILSDEPGCYDDAYIKWVEAHDPTMVDTCRCDTPPAWSGPPIATNPRSTEEPYVFEGPEHLTHSAFVADETISYIRQHKHEPFLAIAGFYAPHAPINPPQRFVDMYDEAEMPLPIRETGQNFKGVSDAQWRKVKAFYYALISHVDDQVGRILDALDNEGLADETLVIFTADHGEMLGDRGEIAKGPPGYDGCSRVPLIVSYPGVFQQGAFSDAIIEAVDLLPTILDTCGIQVPPRLQGRSFRKLLQGGKYSPRDSAFIEYRVPFGRSTKSIRTHDYFYTINDASAEMLFCMQEDPGQLTDLSADPEHADALQAMRHHLLQRWFTIEDQYPLQVGQY